MKTRILQTITTLLFSYTAGWLHAQIQFEQLSPPTPQNIAEFNGVYLSSIAFSDVDGDGDEDVLVTGSNIFFQRTTILYTNNGMGGFTQVNGTPFDGVQEGSIAFADVDGDGDQDVLITGENTSLLHIAKLYTNDGMGGYTLVSGTPFEGVWRSSIAFADVDGDNDQDVLITGYNNSDQPIAKMYTNDGLGGFALVSGTPFEGVSKSSVAFADVDGDGDQDVLITGENSSYLRLAQLYANDGIGGYTLVSGTPFDGVEYGSIAFADVDGDDDPDLLITGANNSFQSIAKLYTNDGSGGYTLVGGTPFDGVLLGAVAFADVDGDDDQDVLITGYNSANQPIAKLYSNDGTGGYSLVSGTPFDGVWRSSIAFSDVDGDADQEVLITGWNSAEDQIATLYTNNGLGGYSMGVEITFDEVQYSSIAFADVDGDDDQDVLITGLSGSSERIAKLYTNDGTGDYTLLEGTPFDGVQLGSIAFADVDGDGDQDVLITGQNPSNNWIAKLYTNDGAGAYNLVNGTPFDGVRFSAIAFADVDGDTDQDVLITGFNVSNQRIAKLYTNDGTGGYSLVGGTPFEGVREGSINFADVDGDGDQDVLITGSTNSSGQRIAKLYGNDGFGGYSLVNGTPFDGVILSASAFADVDGDGDQDVLITGSNSSNQRIAKLYTNDGSGGYALVEGTPFEGVWVGSIAFADVDGDEDQDVLITGQNSLNQRIAHLYSNDGMGGFSVADGTPFDGVYRSSIAFADVDGDGDPDVLISGLNNALEATSKLYKNTTPLACTITAICTPFALLLPQSGMATLIPDSVDGGSKVTCGELILSLSQTEFDTTHIGENTVTLTVTDENGNTDSCQAIVTVFLPDPCRYFLSNHNTQGGSDVYELTINEIANTADMNLLVSVPQRVTLSYNQMENLLYLGRENNSTFQTLNPDAATLGLPIGVNVGLSGFAGATYGPDGMLYAASQTSGAVYRFNPTNFTGSLYSGAQVNGGDIAFTADGELILVSRNPARAFLVNENGPNTILGPVPAGVSGLARRADGTFLLSVQGYDKLITGSTTEGDLGVRFDLKLNGAPFTPANGDLASGCPVPAAAMMVLTDTNLPVNAVDASAKLASQPNPTEGTSIVTFTTETGTRATLEVFDMSGRSVATLFNAEVQPGQEYRAEFNGAALPNGVYIYRLTTDAEVVMEKFMIAR